MSYYYYAFDLNIRSEIILPELLLGSDERQIDVEIHYGVVSPLSLKYGETIIQKDYEKNKKEFLLKQSKCSPV